MKRIILVYLLSLVYMLVFANRKDILINDQWHFRFNYEVQRNSGRLVNLPHTWNALDADAKPDYHRGIGNYTKEIFIPQEWKGKRLYLRFEGANTVTNVFMNDKHIGEHRGGYGAFIFEITDNVNYGSKNQLLVRVNNALQLDVMPLVGDFNFYGGIYRDVHLIITDEVHISLTDYASPGVYLMQKQVSKEQANVQAKIMLSNNTPEKQKRTLFLKVWDGNQVKWEKAQEIEIIPGESSQTFDLVIENPHLWNGRKDPFCYRTEITLLKNGQIADCIDQPLGLRSFRVDAEKGFFLNGEHLKLKGVCRHQERSEVGNALRKEHHEEDAAIIAEMGTNAIRLAHYPQASYMYDLMDHYGIIVWAEIPFVGPGGYFDRGFVDQPAFRENGKEQLKELIRQHYNHPSICFWGLFNELKTYGDNPTEYVKELNQLAKLEDPTRLTTAASNISANDPIGMVSDLIAWNQYFGWYGGHPSDMGTFLDKTHQEFPNLKIAISEYGAGASIYHQQDSIKPGIASGYWHPENYQTFYHMENWKALAERPFVWGSFVWNMFDFGAAHREEGDRPGVNDKGLVTRDRKTRKDAFYFYKANWNQKDAFVYIANRRHRERICKETDIMVFSNQPEVELFINGISQGKQQADAYATFQWKSIQLTEGENKIEVKAGKKKDQVTDSVIWHL